jgi:hypothetical protein
MAKLEIKLELALKKQQIKLLLACTLTSLSSCSAKAPQNKIQSQEHSEIISSWPKELQNACQYSTLA